MNLNLTQVKYIVTHHTATPFDTSVDSIKKGSLHWLSTNDRLKYFGMGYKCDYHWLIDQNGKVYQGQPETLQSFHSGNDEINRQSVSICVVGNLQEYGMPIKQFTGLLQTLMIVHKRYPVSVLKHSMIVSTACPGANFPYEKLLKMMNIKDLNPASWNFKYMVPMLYFNQYSISEKINPDAPLTRAEYAVLKSKENKWV